MRIVSFGAIACLLLLLILVCAFSVEDLEESTTEEVEHFLASDIVPQVYTYVLRPVSGESNSRVTFKEGTSSFISVDTDAPYKVGTFTLTHFKLVREPISKFSLAKRTYEYITLESNVTIDSLDKVTSVIKFKVSKEWLESVGGKPEQMSLFFFSGESWAELDTKLTDSLESYHEFSATTTQFGYFAIAIDRTISSTTGTDSELVDTTLKPALVVEHKLTPDSGDITADTKASNNEAVQVVYPLLDESIAPSDNSFSLRNIVGYALLFFAVTGIAIVGITFAQSRVNRPMQIKQGTSLNELLEKLQSSRAPKISKIAEASTDINALLQKVHARYQPTFSPAKSESVFANGASAIAHTLSHSLEELKEKVSQLEPDLIKRYTDWGISHGHDLVTIKQQLLAHDIDESIVNKALSAHWSKL